jgi:P27 family predicted phage terminase small subunit
MGKRGPAPDPIPIRVLKGRGRGVDQAGLPIPAPPAFDRGAPDCPEHFDDDARELWMRITPGLDELGLVKPQDWPTLIVFCETWGAYREAYRRVRAEGLVTVNPKTGVSYKNPAQRIVETRRCSCCGMPSSLG